MGTLGTTLHQLCEGNPRKGRCTFEILHWANYLPDLTPNKDFLDNYVNNATLMGEAFTIDASEVHTFIVILIAQKE